MMVLVVVMVGCDVLVVMMAHRAQQGGQAHLRSLYLLILEV